MSVSRSWAGSRKLNRGRETRICHCAGHCHGWLRLRPAGKCLRDCGLHLSCLKYRRWVVSPLDLSPVPSDPGRPVVITSLTSRFAWMSDDQWVRRCPGEASETYQLLSSSACLPLWTVPFIYHVAFSQELLIRSRVNCSLRLWAAWRRHR